MTNMSGKSTYTTVDESPDGLPYLQPTRTRVDDALEYTDYSADEVIATIPPKGGRATAEKIAANAVMAGCEPRYLPIVISAVEAVTKEGFNLEAIINTTHPVWPVVMVNGPLRNELEINYGANALGQGFRANATIGRAITFICTNIGGAVPAESDRATHGGPPKFGLCFGENEEKNPWDPYHVEKGYDVDTSTVTVFGAESPHNIEDHVARSGASILTTVAHSMATLGTNIMYYNGRGEPYVVLGPEHADKIAEDGWTKQDVKRFLYDQARVPKHLTEGRGLDVDTEESETPWAKHFNVADPHQMVGLCPAPEYISIIVAGGPGRHSRFLPSFGDTSCQTVPVTTRDDAPVKSVEDFKM